MLDQIFLLEAFQQSSDCLQYIVMFLDNFQQQTSVRQSKQKVAKRQYSAGFKNYHPPKPALSSDEQILSQDDHLFAQLKIGNLRQLYLQSLPQEDNSHQRIEEQKMSIARLTETHKKQSPAEDQEQEQHKQQTKAQLQAKFMKTYHRVDDYQEKAIRMLFRNEFEKMKAKIEELLKKKRKTSRFEQVFAGLMLDRVLTYKDKIKITNDQLLLDLANFVNKTISSAKAQEIKVQDLQAIICKNLFLLGLFDIKSSEERYLNQQQLQSMIKINGCDDSNLQWEIVEKLISKRITVPYQSQLYQSYNQSTRVQSPAEQIKSPNQSHKFHATAIPKTTYQRPKQRPKSQMAKTKPQPFNLTVSTSKVQKMQDFYKWDRSVHPRQVPLTTYKPNTIKLMSQQQKKKRALGVLHEADYPSTMKYLNNYHEEQQRKRNQLQSKYTKDKRLEYIRDVPNFELIHRRNLQQMEEIKLERQQLTKPQPFNLSQPRKPKEPIMYNPAIDQQEEQVGKIVKNIFKEPKVKPASTLKFDSYVDHLKKKKEQKIEKQQAKKKEQMKNNKAQFKEILKNRVHCEIGKVPKNNVYPQQNVPSNTVKVNLENIYHNEPLLMERETVKSKQYGQPVQKNWQPII